MQSLSLAFGGTTFIASVEKILWHQKSRTLLIADCHFGKAGHFRRNNIPIPPVAAIADLQNLQHCLDKFQPLQCVFLGDLFHSARNYEWDWLRLLLHSNRQTAFTLVEGNHDILPIHHYEKAGVPVVDHLIMEDRILLTHEPTKATDRFNICGHIHPGFSISGKGREHISMPCFCVTEKQLIMPAFGKLTGFVTMNKQLQNGQAICIAGGEIFAVQVNEQRRN